MKEANDYRVYKLTEESRVRLVAGLSAALAAHDEVVFAYLYGSAATEDHCRDVDVGVSLACVLQGSVMTTEQATREDSWGIEAALAEELAPVVERCTGQAVPVDVRGVDGASVVFQYHVLRGVLLKGRDEEAHARFLERVLPQYFDLLPLRERALGEVLSR
jgi:predicted nucleotidyltransferase